MTCKVVKTTSTFTVVIRRSELFDDALKLKVSLSKEIQKEL